MSSFEKLAIEHLAHKFRFSSTPEIESQLFQLFKNIREGNFCCFIENPCILPDILWELGVDTQPFPKRPLIIQHDRLYLQKTWVLETLILQRISALLRRPFYHRDQAELSKNLLEMNPLLTNSQKKAILNAFEKSLAIFTGGPGTGKSYTAAWFIRLLATSQGKNTPFKTIITAPTGKAAAHLEAALQSQGPYPEQLRCESITLHRLLRLSPYRQKYKSVVQLDCDLVVVDEASMLDASLLLHLLNAIGAKTCLLLLGDPNQLAPIEGMGFFPEIADLFGERLDQSIRMGEGTIFELSQAILQGKFDRALNIKSEAVKWIPWISNIAELKKWIFDILPSPFYKERPDPLQLLQEQKKFRILSTLRQGPFGVDALNRHIMATIHQERIEGWIAIPILIIQNNPDKQLYNGTMGILIKDQAGAMAYFLMSEGIRSIPEAALPAYEAAFCLSVHKSQGSEFDEVLILMGPGSERFGKEALYTAITRAKKRVNLCIEEATFRATLGIKRKNQSGFIDRIGAYLKECADV